MAIIGTLTGSRSITFTAIFAAMIAILDSIPMIPGFYGGIWDSWGFMLSPIVGILLGPLLGAIAVGLGGFVGHLVAGLVYQQRWKFVFALYSLLLLGYFLTPVTWVLSLWGIWDVLVVFALVLGLTVLSSFNKTGTGILSSTTARLALGTVIGLEVGITLRIFILIPGQVYWFFYGLPVEELQLMWLVAGFITPIKVIVATIASVAIGKSLLRNFQNKNHDSDNQLTME